MYWIRWINYSNVIVMHITYFGLLNLYKLQFFWKDFVYMPKSYWIVSSWIPPKQSTKIFCNFHIVLPVNINWKVYFGCCKAQILLCFSTLAFSQNIIRQLSIEMPSELIFNAHCIFPVLCCIWCNVFCTSRLTMANKHDDPTFFMSPFYIENTVIEILTFLC